MKKGSDIKFGTVLSSLRKEKGWTMEELGHKMSKTKSAVSRWESGENSPKVDDIEKLSQLFEVDVQMLIFGIDETENDIINIYNKLNSTNQNKVIDYSKELLDEQNSNIIDMTEWTDIDIYSVLSAGTGVVDLEPSHIERISYNGYVPKNYDMAFRVQGDSMEPVFEDGEIIFVEKDMDVRNGQIGAVIINEEAYIKKMYVENGQLRLVSLNRKYEDIIANENDDIEIVGRVVL